MSYKTVFVIGAGASKEANLPTGVELKSQIAQLLDIQFGRGGYQQETGDFIISNALEEHVKNADGRRGDINPYLYEAWHIRDALPLAISIDNFIDSQSGNDRLALCGKLAIVRAILEAEENSLLYFKKEQADSNINFIKLDQTWYLPFFQLLTENCGKDDLKKRFHSITLIIFNYDRCIEHFIFYPLQRYYKLDRDEAADITKSINIYHPYGRTGSLPWYNQEDAIDFGAVPNPKQLLKLAQGIKTFTEGTDPESSEIKEIRNHLSTMDKLVFLGFAFHKLNMQLIKPEDYEDIHISAPTCYATTLGISKSDEEVIRVEINELLDSDIKTEMSNKTCYDFFGEFWKSMVF